MRNTSLVIAVGAGIVAGLAMHASLEVTAVAQRPSAANPDRTEMIVSSAKAVDGGQNLILVDPQTQTIGTYHIDAATGGITLRSVRNIRWDFMMEEFNAGVPKPNEIRALLEQK